MKKEIRIFDAGNKVLKVKGIRFELYEVASGTLLDHDSSDDLGMRRGGGASNDWGVELDFSAVSGPVEVYTSDPKHRYPGNMIESLEGANNNRIDIDLSPLPTSGGGQGAPLTTTAVEAVSSWVGSGGKWSEAEKRAVRRLIFNYAKLRAEQDAADKPEFADLLRNWEDALQELGVRIALSAPPLLKA